MKAINIISFDVPYPANYGGVIDVFYKIQKEIPSKLLLVGEGPDREFIEFKAKNLGIFDKVFIQ